MRLDRSILRMTDTERDEFLTSHLWGRLSTVNAAGEPHTAPIGYIYLRGVVYFHAMVASRRGRDLAAGSLCCLCVDDGVGPGQDYAERRGVILYGRVAMLDREAPGSAELLDEIRPKYATVFFGDPDRHFERRSHAWYAFTWYRCTSWDFGRIPPGTDREVPAAGR